MLKTWIIIQSSYMFLRTLLEGIGLPEPYFRFEASEYKKPLHICVCAYYNPYFFERVLMWFLFLLSAVQVWFWHRGFFLWGNNLFGSHHCWFLVIYGYTNLRKKKDKSIVSIPISRVENAEVLCLGLVSIAVFMVVMPLFRATGSILLQMAPTSVPSSALNKCWRQVCANSSIHSLTEFLHNLVPIYFHVEIFVR